MKKIIMVFIGTIFLNGCVGWSINNLLHQDQEKNQATIRVEPTIKYCNFSAFRSIVVSGDAQVELIQSKRNHAARIVGVNADQYDCASGVVDQTLYIKSGDKQDKMSGATVEIYTPQLNRIAVAGNATLGSRKFSSHNLQVSARGCGNVNLHGKFNIKKIDQYGNGRINIDWIDSDKLAINGNGNGPIYLGGRVDNLLVKLMHNARLYARYLRAQEAKVFTTDNASAEVLPVENLDAFAVNHSNIFYYKRPEKITIVTKDSANVLYSDWVR